MTALKNFMASKKNGLFFVGHSSALVRLGDDLVLFDGIWGPVAPYSNFIFHPKQIDCTEAIPHLTAAITSHEHADHWCPEILQQLPCPMYIMDGRARLRRRLAEFCDVVEFPRMRWNGLFRPRGRVDPGAEILFIHNPRNTVDSSCLIRGNGFMAYLGSDNFLDRKLCQEVSNQGRPDVACVPYSFVHYYPALLEMDETKKTEEAYRLKRQSLDAARMFKDVVQPKILIPFGNNLFYCEGPGHPLNACLAKPQELTPSPLLTGDWTDGNQIHATNSWTYSEWRPLPPMDFGVELTDRQLTSVINRVRKAATNAPGHAITVNDALTIDCESKRVYESFPEAVLRDRKLHRFWFDKPVFKAWASGKISFSDALGSRRFKYSRNPDIFDAALANWWETSL